MHKKLIIILAAVIATLGVSCSDKPEGFSPEPTTTGSVKFPESITPEPLLGPGQSSTTVNFTATAPWSAHTDMSRAIDWLTVYPMSGAAGEVTLTVSAEANDTYDDRNGAVTITCGNASVTFTVNQKKKDGLIIESARRTIDAEGGTLEFTAMANQPLSFEIDEECRSWISASPASRGLESKSFSLIVSPNEGYESRQGTVRVSAGDASEIVTVYQASNAPHLIVSDHDLTVSGAGGTVTVEVQSNIGYKMQLPSGCNWVHEADNASRSSYTHRFSVDANPNTEPRTATIMFVSDDASFSEAVTIHQTSRSAIAVALNEYTVSADGGRLDLKVQSTTEFDVKTSASWIQHVPGARSRAFVEYDLCFDINRHTDRVNSRQGTITLTSKDGTVKQEILVIQNPAGKEIASVESKYYVFFQSFPTGSTFWQYPNVRLVHTTTYSDGTQEHKLIDRYGNPYYVNYTGPMYGLTSHNSETYLRPPYVRHSAYYNLLEYIETGKTSILNDPYAMMDNFDAEYLSPILRAIYFSDNESNDIISNQDLTSNTEVIHVPRHEIKLSVPVDQLVGERLTPELWYTNTQDLALRERMRKTDPLQGYFSVSTTFQPYTIFDTKSHKEDFEKYSYIEPFALTDTEKAKFAQYFGRPFYEIEEDDLRKLSVSTLYDIFDCRSLPNPLLGLPDGEYSTNYDDWAWAEAYLVRFYIEPTTGKYWLVGTPDIKVHSDKIYGYPECKKFYDYWHNLQYPLLHFEILRFAVETINGRKIVTHSPADTGTHNWSLKFKTVEDTEEATTLVATLKVDSRSHYTEVAPLDYFQMSNWYFDTFNSHELVTDTLVYFKERPGAPFRLNCHIQQEAYSFWPVEILPGAVTNLRPEDFIISSPDLPGVRVLRPLSESDVSNSWMFPKSLYGKVIIDIPGEFYNETVSTVIEVRHKDYPDYCEKLYLRSRNH
ncbi:MAG: hypothetical protein K2N16_09130 [Muribaculaceae bacterium]|nr:hypothetical protein [Muribaculaceae bacterium]